MLVDYKMILWSKHSNIISFNRNSNYVKSRIIPSLTVEKVKHRRIKMLMYINYMMAFRSYAFDNVRNRQRMVEKLKNPPNIIFDKLYERFVDRTFVKIGGNEW